MRCVIALLAILAAARSARAAEDISIDAGRAGDAVAVRVRAVVQAPFALIWQTLTDYDHLAEFIPGMTRSHVIGRRGSAAIVEQKGEAGFLMFTYPIDVVVESDEHSPSWIGIRVLEGNLRRLDGGYRLERVAGSADRFALSWSGIVEPDISLPLFITVPLLRANIADQFLGMVKEIERRRSMQVQATHE